MAFLEVRGDYPKEKSVRSEAVISLYLDTQLWTNTYQTYFHDAVYRLAMNLINIDDHANASYWNCFSVLRQQSLRADNTINQTSYEQLLR